MGIVGAGGFFTAKKIGQTEVTANGITCKVSVVPYHNLCAEPYTVFGSSVATIKANEKRTVAVENSTGISFRGENSNLNGVIYLIEAGKSISAALIFANMRVL